MKTIFKLLSAALILVTFSSHAGWSNFNKINDLRVYNGQAILGSLVGGNLISASNCATSNTSFVLDTSTELFAETYSILLAAQTNQSRVSLYTRSSCDNHGRAVVTGARMRN